ncbi:MAG: hypothetical protein GEU90_09140 [Gemmatimonas sp.]|nr:hypothetical protein [Gemmatimonas sp.]
MALRERLTLGAPGIYPRFNEPLRALTGVRMDVAAFVGVAPRGPSRLPAYLEPWAEPPRGMTAPGAALRSVAVPVESWEAYRRFYGGFEGPGLLPYAVAAFFENGGRRAYVVRVVHDYGEGDPENDAATAGGDAPGLTAEGGAPFRLLARSEGSWGNRLGATIGFRGRPLAYLEATVSGLTLNRDAPVAPGTLLRLWLSGGVPELRFVSDVRREWTPEDPILRLEATLETALPEVPERVEIIEADLTVTDRTDDGIDRDELHEGLGLSPLHHRWVAAVLHRESRLVRPDVSWLDNDLTIDDPTLLAAPAPADPQFSGGRDRYPDVVHDDFFDLQWVPGDEQARSGIHALVELEGLSILVVPDLYSPGPLIEPREIEEVISLAGPTFEPCVELPPPPEAPEEGDGSDGQLDGLQLDPTIAPDRDQIIALQQQVIDLAELLRSWIVLLDVPPGLNQREILAWRSDFGTDWAAGYHPWVRVSRPDDARVPLISVNPSAFAAGIVAKQELAFGVPHGPANEILTAAVLVTDSVTPARHDELHQSAINVLLSERDGIRLTAARTLSRDPQWRQLSVRRLVTMLARTILQQMQWAVFEPNDARFRDEVKRLLEGYLKQLFLANAFRGATPRESYFVRCDEVLNPPQVVDVGQLFCDVGVAPAEPMEFIVLHLTREGDNLQVVA